MISDSDQLEFIFSSQAVPATPQNVHPYPSDSYWSKSANEDTIWMAMSKCSNGEWSDWSIMKIKGEKGDTGEKGRDGVNGSQLRYLGTWNSTKCYCFQSRVAVSETLSNNVYKYDGKLYTDIAKPSSIWSQDGILYIDVVSVVKDKVERYFQATQNSCGVPPLSDAGNVNTGWEEAQHFGMLLTDYMIAKVIDASKVSANEIIIKDSDDKVIGGITNSTSPTLPDKEEHLVFWTGSDGNDSEGKAGDSSKNAKFKVYDDGRIVCAGINSQINGLATSTQEVIVELADLPYIEDGNYFYLDFTQYGPNILIKNSNTQITDEIANYSLAIDFPAYCFSGDLVKDNGSATHAFSKLGVSTTSSGYMDSVYSYMNFVDKYKRTNVRIRTNNIELPGLLKLRGCLTMQKTIGDQSSTGYSNPLQTVESYTNLIDCSVGAAVANPYTSTDSINSYYDISYPYNTNQNSFVLSSNNNGVCIMDYPIYTSLVKDEKTGEQTRSSVVSFDLCFTPKVFSINNQGSNLSANSSFADISSSMYHGVYWETRDVYHPATSEMIATTYDFAEKPSTYIK